MNIVNKSLLALLALGAVQAVDANSFFNYKAGDKALFSGYRGDTDVAVTSESGNWRQHSSFLGESNVWLYTVTGSDKIHVRNAAGQSQLLVDLAASTGSRFPGQFGACVDQATIAAKGLTLRTDDGAYSNVVRVDFRNTCGHSGLSKAWFAPKVGVVRYEQINGRAMPVVNTLAAAQVGGVTFPEKFGLKLSAEAPAQRIVLRSGDHTEIANTLTITNTSNKALPVMFRSGQSADAELINAEGVVVNSWSADRVFTQAIVNSSIDAGEAWRYSLSVPAVHSNGEELDIGTYTLRLSFLGRLSFGSEPLYVNVPVYIDRHVGLIRPVVLARPQAAR